MLKRFIVLIASTLVATSLLTGVAGYTPTAFAVGCTGSGCTGRDPNIQGCGNDARTVDSFMGNYGSNLGESYIELRYSPACRSRWLRVTPKALDFGCGGGPSLQVRLRDISGSGGVFHERLRTYGACDAQFWTLMVGRDSISARTQFCFREGTTRAWGSDSYYAPCKSPAWP